MQIYLDTSAVIPLLLQEPHSEAARKVWEHVEQAWTWDWMKVEAESALLRRKAVPDAWRQWRALAGQIRWLKPPETFIDDLCNFNRALGLRAADAGHLFVCDRAMNVIPSMTLVTFDTEMRKAARRMGLPLH